jgi:tRNA pseudouridine55 synthase
MMPTKRDIEGVLPVDKPTGPTSHDVVARARRAMGERRIGHTGTLDPFASGLLLLCVGRATRIAEYLTDMDKSYRATVRLGSATETDDLTGAVVAESDTWRDLDEATIRAAFAAEVGAREQEPPAYSAKKVGGERAYKRARRGEEVVLPPAAIEIHSLDVVDITLPDVTFDVRCSSGTYVRAIGRDVARRLGTHGHLVALRRTAIGAHRVEQAVPLEALDDPARTASALVPSATALAVFPHLHVDDEDARHLTHGRPISHRLEDAEPVVILHDDRLLAIGRAIGGRVEPRKVFV